MKVLLVEDDPSIASVVSRGLGDAGFGVEHVGNGKDAITAQGYDFVLLDLGLPDMDGFDVCKAIRLKSQVPIIILTARSDEFDRVVGLELGADDYVVKPFGMRELVARIRAVLRRGGIDQASHDTTIVVGALSIDEKTRRALIGSKELALTPKEFDLLAYLAASPDVVHRRNDILEHVWDTEWYGPTKTLDAHVAALRKKLGNQEWIEAVRGVGFRLKDSCIVRRRLVLAVVGLVAIILVVHDVPLRSHLKRVEQDRVITALERDAFTLAAKSQQLLASESPSTEATPNGVSLSSLVNDYETMSTADVLIVSGAGAVEMASDITILVGTSVLNRPEIASALLGNSTVGVRRSETLKADLVYAAVPVLTSDSVIGAVRLTYPKSVVDARVASRLKGILLVALISLLMAFVAALIIASSAVRPLRRLKERADNIADGDLSARAEVEGPPEIRELAVSFNEMVARVEQMLAEQRGFAADASHQLRTPLTALRLRIEQAQMSALKPEVGIEELNEDLEAASGEIERLQRLVEQLLALARTEKKNMLVDVDVAAVIQGRLDMWNSLAEERNVMLQFAVPEKIFVKVIDGSLEQILDNYIDNALDYAPEHSFICLEVEVSERDVKLSLADEGPGMPTEARQHAFDRFWRGAESQNRPGGSGLGLSIVAQLAAASGGTVELSQNTPTGLVASVSLRKSAPNK